MRMDTTRMQWKRPAPRACIKSQMRLRNSTGRSRKSQRPIPQCKTVPTGKYPPPSIRRPPLERAHLHEPGRQGSKGFVDDIDKNPRVGILVEIGACPMTYHLRFKILTRVPCQQQHRNVSLCFLDDLQKC